MRMVKIIGSVLALLLVTTVGIAVIGFVTGESNMKDYYAAVFPGTAIRDVELSAREKEYRYHEGIETKPGSGEYVSLPAARRWDGLSARFTMTAQGAVQFDTFLTTRRLLQANTGRPHLLRRMPSKRFIRERGHANAIGILKLVF